MFTRRKLMAGAGTAAAAWNLTRSGAARAAGAPIRLILFPLLNGADPRFFWPNPGNLRAMSLVTQPLARYQSQLMFVRGIDIAGSFNHMAVRSMFTGVPIPDYLSPDPTVKSVDQVMADHVARTAPTKIKSLHLGVIPADSIQLYQLYGRSTFFFAPRPVDYEANPVAAFDRTFRVAAASVASTPPASRGLPDSEPTSLQDLTPSPVPGRKFALREEFQNDLLDIQEAELNDIMTRVGGSMREMAKLEQHREALRTLRPAPVPGGLPVPPPGPGMIPPPAAPSPPPPATPPSAGPRPPAPPGPAPSPVMQPPPPRPPMQQPPVQQPPMQQPQPPPAPAQPPPAPPRGPTPVIGGIASVEKLRPSLQGNDAAAYRHQFYSDIFDAQIDILARAVVTGITRVATIQAGSADGNVTDPVGGGLPHHNTSHGSPELFAQCQQWYATKFLRLLQALDVPDPLDPGRTVLHNSVVLLMSECMPVGHESNSVPVLLAGRAGGALRSGYVDLKGATNLALMQTVLQLCGAGSAPHFGGTTFSELRT